MCGSAPVLAATAPASSTAPAGLDLAARDLSVRPGDDFYGYANGTWLRTAQIPADRSGWGNGAELVELTNQRLAQLIQQVAAKGGADPDARKIADYYATFMDESTIERKGLQPLKPELDRIAAIRNAQQLAHALGETLRADVDVLNNTRMHTPNLFGLWVAQDLDEPTQYSPILLQGGLTLPDRDYYLSPSPHMQEIRTRFREHIAAVLRLAGQADATAQAARIFDLEHRMAEVHWSRAESEDVQKGNNHWSREDFVRKAPGLDWPAFFAAAELSGQNRFMVWQPSAVTGLAALVAHVPLQAWKDYLTFHALERACAYLDNAFVEESFALHGKLLEGTPQLQPRWKRAVDFTSDALGEAVGRLYVARYFPPASKERIEVLVRNLLAAFNTRIDRLAWMSPQTKAKAKAKLATLKVGVGYPDRWRDYSGLQVVRGDALGNAQRASRFEYHRNLAKLGHPVDRSEWVMTPQTINAVNLPVMNALNFPAAILQPPYFDPRRPMVMDYGAIGAIIGHEISHSFDNQGAQFDSTGRLLNWWTREDFAHFSAAAARLAAQYDRYRPFPDLHVNGTQTLSENIADVAGLSAAYDAYHLAYRDERVPAVGGLSGDQQFFLSFAQSWRQKTREPALRQRIVTDGHAPAEYRADTVRNLDPWYAAFEVQPGQKLYLPPQQRVPIW
jgi:predicted metalloendopeptidase